MSDALPSSKVQTTAGSERSCVMSTIALNDWPEIQYGTSAAGTSAAGVPMPWNMSADWLIAPALRRGRSNEAGARTTPRRAGSGLFPPPGDC